MPNETISCLVISSNSEFSGSLIKLLNSLEGVLIKPDIREGWNISDAGNDNSRYDLCIYYVNETIKSKDEIPLAASSVKFPVAYVLESCNYKLAYEMLHSGAFECLCKDDLTRDSILKLTGRIKPPSRKKEQKFEWTAIEAISYLLKDAYLGFAIFENNGIMLDCNSRLQHLLGFTKRRMLSLNLSEIFSANNETGNTLDRLENGEVSYLETERPFFNKSGDLVYCRLFLTVSKKNKHLPELFLLLVSDITNRRIMQQELEKEKYYLQTLLDNIPDAIYFKDIEHHFIKASKYVHLQGINSPDEAIGKTDFDFFAAEHAQDAYNDEEDIIRSGKPIINKVEKETFPDGKIAWVSTTKAPLLDSDQNVSGIVGISRDITEIKLKEEALQKSEERYRNLIEYSPDTISILCENKIVFTNAAGINLLKANSREDILGRDIREFLPPKFEATTLYLLDKIIKDKTPAKAIKGKLKRFDGSVIDVEITSIPTTFYEKPAIQIIIRDITANKKQERIKYTALKILQASNFAKTIDELFKYIHQAIGHLMPVNNFYIAFYDEKSGMISFPYFVDEEDDQMLPKKLGKGLTEYVLRLGQSQLISEQMDIELREKGEVELVGAPAKIWLGVPLQVKDKTIGVMVVQDYNNEMAYTENEKQILELISFSVSRAIERKIAEDEILNFNQQLKETNATKDRFFSYISHDLRSPFSSLLGFSDLVLADFESLSKEEIKHYLEIIRSSSANLYNLLNDLLQFTRFQTGRVQLNPKRLNLKGLIHNNVELIKGNAIKKEISVINYINKDILVYADEEMISSVIQNLMSNAIKFTPRKGEIKLCCSLVPGSKTVEVSVSDTGVGMSKETIAKLFRIEVIQTTTGTEKETGTGLGLLLAKESVDKNGGKIWVESELNKGTTFKFTLPLSEEFS